MRIPGYWFLYYPIYLFCVYLIVSNFPTWSENNQVIFLIIYFIIDILWLIYITPAYEEDPLFKLYKSPKAYISISAICIIILDRLTAMFKYIHNFLEEHLTINDER
jgi:hypothetical protein